MGWRGTLRSINAATKAAAREAERRHKADLKQQISQSAAEDVENWKHYLTALMSVHTNLAEKIDWQKLGSAPQPVKPIDTSQQQAKAQAALSSFKPGLITKLMGNVAAKTEALARDVESAKAEDDRRNSERYLAYMEELSEWERDTKFAKDILAGDDTTIIEVIKEYQSITDEGLIGNEIGFGVESGLVSAFVQCHTDEIIPNFRRKQLASGKLSETKMPKGEFNEIYQDYVASVAIRLAGDLFQMLPVTETIVTCATSMLNSSTGHKEVSPILSVHFVRSSFEQLNLKHIDPSDALSNFRHNMVFKRTKGFSVVEEIQKVV